MAITARAGSPFRELVTIRMVFLIPPTVRLSPEAGDVLE
jgi:hypothetical protein